jgi:hypothetical protein
MGCEQRRKGREEKFFSGVSPGEKKYYFALFGTPG